MKIKEHNCLCYWKETYCEESMSIFAPRNVSNVEVQLKSITEGGGYSFIYTSSWNKIKK